MAIEKKHRKFPRRFRIVRDELQFQQQRWWLATYGPLIVRASRQDMNRQAKKNKAQ